MSSEKKRIREQFRNAVFERDRFLCRACGTRCEGESQLDAHHITDRNQMPMGGYVKENGISLCPNCHIKAEHFHSTGVAHPGFTPDDLYAMIDSSRERAVRAAERLK